MNLEETAEKSISSAFEKHLAASDSTPSWWTEFKKDSFEKFSSLPMPNRKNEYWRFSNLKGIKIDDYSFGEHALIEDAYDLIERSSILCQHSGSYVFADNQTVHMQQAAAELREKGVIWCTLREAVKHHSELLRDYFMKQEADLGSEKFAALHSAFVENGVLLYVPKGVEVEDPFVVYNWATSADAAIFPHTLVITEEFSKAQIVEAQFSKNEADRAFSCGVTHLFAGCGSKIDYTLLQDYNEQTLGFQINSNIAGKDATVKTASVNVGCRQYRSETHGRIKGAGAHVDMYSLAVTDADQEIDQRTLQTHSAAHATSNLLFKNALQDSSKTIFSGLIKVDEGAQQTDAYQTNRNLLLSNKAEANSLPGLEIEANDVKCSHGATTAQIEDEEIFYMLARGIPRHKAQELIVYGFFEEIIDELSNESLAENARRIIQSKFQKNA
ncbi:MAG: Fe-S cluster assembly protein SufD [Verrucomicrobiota bacterium]